MNDFEEEVIDKITILDNSDKEMFLENQDELIDKGIRELTDVINSIDFLMTVNSCQGSLIPEEANNHCPLTYVDFYVMDHKYHIANLLMTSLVSEFGNSIECGLSFEPDFDLIDENIVEDNGYVNFRYRIQLDDLEIYKKVIEKIDEFKNKIN